MANLLADRMAIQDTQVGSAIEDLNPAAGHAADGLYDKQWQSKVFPEGADLFDPDIVSEAMGTITAVPSARGKGKEGPGMDAGPSTGSEGDNGGGGGRPLPDKIIAWPG